MRDLAHESSTSAIDVAIEPAPTKVCTSCDEEKSLSEYGTRGKRRARGGGPAYFARCRECTNAETRLYRWNTGRVKRRIHRNSGTAKLCTKCPRVLPIEMFVTSGGKQVARCSDCRRAYQRARYVADAERIKARERAKYARMSAEAKTARRAQIAAWQSEHASPVARARREARRRHRLDVFNGLDTPEKRRAWAIEDARAMAADETEMYLAQQCRASLYAYAVLGGVE